MEKLKKKQFGGSIYEKKSQEKKSIRRRKEKTGTIK